MKNFLFTIFCIIIVLIISFNIFSSLNIPFFGFNVYRVASGSMEPTIETNSFVIIKEDNVYNVGDIITYKKNDDYITHRIISIDGNSFITKGDANNIEDDPVDKRAVVGKMLFNLNINAIINFLFTPWISLIVIFFMGLFITCMIPDKKEKTSGKHANW